MVYLSEYCAGGTADDSNGACAGTALNDDLAADYLFLRTLDQADLDAAADAAGDHTVNLNYPKVPDKSNPPKPAEFLHLGDEEYVIGPPGFVIAYSTHQATSSTLDGGPTGGTCQTSGQIPTGRQQDYQPFYTKPDKSSGKQGERYTSFDTYKLRRWSYAGTVQSAANSIGLYVMCAHGYARPSSGYSLRWYQFVTTAVPGGGGSTNDAYTNLEYYDWVPSVVNSNTTYGNTIGVGGTFGSFGVSYSVSVSHVNGVESWGGAARATPRYNPRDPVYGQYKNYNAHSYWRAYSTNTDVHSTRGLVLFTAWSYWHKYGPPSKPFRAVMHTCQGSGIGSGCAEDGST
jgi:hypothetical protein